MSKIVSIIAIKFTILLGALNVYAANDGCGDWVLTRDGCIFGSYNHTGQWRRDCSNSSNQCSSPRPPNNYRRACVATVLCLPRGIDPNTDFDICTSWERRDDVECSDEDGNLVPQWIRACQKHYIPTTACSRNRPRD